MRQLCLREEKSGQTGTTAKGDSCNQSIFSGELVVLESREVPSCEHFLALDSHYRAAVGSSELSVYLLEHQSRVSWTDPAQQLKCTMVLEVCSILVTFFLKPGRVLCIYISKKKKTSKKREDTDKCQHLTKTSVDEGQ